MSELPGPAGRESATARLPGGEESRRQLRGGKNWLQELLEGEKQVLEMIATNAPIASGLDAVSRVIEAGHALAEELSFQASHDTLTGLYNRDAFERRLHELLDDARQKAREHALCYLDLDQFKVINDSCGHAAGDELLRQLGSRLRSQVVKPDMLARLGGDEFGVLLKNCSLVRAKRQAAALRRTIKDFRFRWQDEEFSIGVSIGLVRIVESSESTADILRAADSACYAAKDEGRNRIRTYRPDDTDLVRRSGEMRWVNRIRLALEEGRFGLDYQPIVPVCGPPAGGAFIELLLRMEAEDGRRIGPDAFLGAAERFHLATLLDSWVVAAASDWLKGHPQHLEQVAMCSINLSGQSLTDRDFLRFVLRELEAKQIPPEKLCFEITETTAIANLPHAEQFIRVLRTLGCRFALDDFGTGFSSFAYLKSLPVDYLKIDGMFVVGLLEDRFDLAVIRQIVELSQVIGKQTIAEFVESDLILSKLEQIGVDYAQGYAVGRPQPLETMTLPLAPVATPSSSASVPRQLELRF